MDVAHRMHVPELRSLGPAAGATLSVSGEEARHALRVKRLRPSEHVELRDGAGFTVLAQVMEPRDGEPGRKNRDPQCVVRVISVREHPIPMPRLHVRTAVPKGSRLDDMLGALCQVGASSWSPLRSARGIVNPRETRLDRLARLCVEASKQCGRAWDLELHSPAWFDQALRSDLASAPAVVADASGAAFTLDPRFTGDLHLFIGPEGGWTPDELALARDLGAQIVRFGPHVMRIETAAVVAAGVMMGLLTREHTVPA
ncbi:MAG: 16S rRNA (uracil(1498)-N(3))-methyltransferase [Phycisphaerales bacterium]